MPKRGSAGNFDHWLTDRLSIVGVGYVAASEYYIDSVAGNDANSGRHPTEPWENLAMLDTVTLAPGDRVRLARGSDWDLTGDLAGMSIPESGTADKPIYFEPYGSGAVPIISNTQTWSRCIELLGSYLYVYELYLTDAHEAGIYIEGDYCFVSGCEITNVGQGILINNGSYNEAYNCNVHDLNMVVNTAGTIGDDYGALGISLVGADRTNVSYCTFTNCRAISNDFGFAGGAIDMSGGGTDNNIFHHNWAEGCEGFFEINGTCTNNTFHYNVCHDNGFWGGLKMVTGTISLVYLYNNTVVEETPTDELLIFRNGAPNALTLIARNNIMWSDATPMTNSDGFTHTQNVYYRDDAGALGLTPGGTEFNADPQFLNRLAEEFHITVGSPAVDTATDLGYTLDYDDNTVPRGPAPDIGAYELQYDQNLCTVVAVPVAVALGVY